ncbi:hypothetical protein [Brevibacillus dissolubilis]|uniref:hypothetical protein n=1 Tax=Brevibacillus dissolubilis TaxID=1844116 RepID=UPI00159BA709|nr:hypothetical protein [Brevibacillus dissolubilis]
MKKAPLLLSCILSVAFLSGCGSSDTQPASSTATVSEEEKKKIEEEVKQKLEQEAKQKAEEEAKKKAEEEAKKQAEAAAQAASQQFKVADYMAYAIPNMHEINGNDAGAAFPDASMQFLKAKIHLFPATKQEINEARALVDKNVGFKHLDKNIAKYNGVMFRDTGHVIEIEEVPDTDIGTVSVVHVLNDDFDSYQILFPGPLEIFKDDQVEFIGVPVMMSGFDNVSGGFTKVAIIAGSHIGKQ